VVYSNEDRQEFARSLWRRQVKFYFQVCTLQLELALYPLGWTSVDARSLLDALGAMRTQVQQMSSAGPALSEWA
jgi:hypothetical protein